MITIETTRYSTVVRAFVEQFPTATVKLNKIKMTESVDSWCTNARLQKAIDFSLLDGKMEILGFHDQPKDMWASDKALPLVQELAAKKVLRFTVSEAEPRSFFCKTFSRNA